MKIAKVKISVDYQDGTWSEYQTDMPNVVSDHLLVQFQQWRDTYLFSTTEHEKIEKLKSEPFEKRKK